MQNNFPGVQLTWDNPENSIQQRVYLRAQGTTQWIPVFSQYTDSLVISRTILPNTKYEFKVESWCGDPANLQSSQADTISCTTLDGLACTTPTNVRVIPVDANGNPLPEGADAGTRVKITWDPVPTAVRYLLRRSYGINEQATTNSHIFSNLQPDTWYTFSVQSYCSNGLPDVLSGVSADVRFKTGRGSTCTQVTNLLVVPASNSATFTWIQPSGPGIAIPDGYEIHYKPKTDLVWQAARPLAPLSGFTITGLISATAYDFRFFTRCGTTMSAESPETSGSFATVLQAGRAESAEEENKQLMVYPNPSENQFNLMLKNAYIGKVTMNIYDMMGRKVKTLELDKPDQVLESTFELTEFNQGMYLLEINLGKERVTRRLMKQ